MGATQSGYWLSWFIWNSMEIFLIALGVAIFGSFIGNWISNMDTVILFLYILLFGLSQMALFSFLSVFINNLKLGGFIGGFGFWLLNFAFSYLLQVASYDVKVWLCFIPNFGMSLHSQFAGNSAVHYDVVILNDSLHVGDGVCCYFRGTAKGL